jgi:hypothetical protein
MHITIIKLENRRLKQRRGCGFDSILQPKDEIRWTIGDLGALCLLCTGEIRASENRIYMQQFARAKQTTSWRAFRYVSSKLVEIKL